MVCSKCGSQIDNSCEFCMNCGTAVQRGYNAPPPPPPQPVNAVPYNGQNGYGYNGMQVNALNAKEYISSVGTCRLLGIVALICVLLTQPIDIIGVVCAAIAISKIKKLPEVRPELLDPQSLYAYQKAERESESARKLAKAAIIIEVVWLSVSALVAIGGVILTAMGVALPFLPFITDFIETIFM